MCVLCGVIGFDCQRISKTVRNWIKPTPGQKRLGTELTNIPRQQFCSLPFLVLNIRCLLYLLSPIGIFPLFVCFDILWQLATTHATRTQIVRTKMTSPDAIFCRGNKSSSRSLASFCRRNIRYLLLVLRTCGVWVQPALWGQRPVTAKNKACNYLIFPSQARG